MNTTSRFGLAAILVSALMLGRFAPAAHGQGADRTQQPQGKWVIGPDGHRYFQYASTAVVLPAKRQTALKSSPRTDQARVKLVGHSSGTEPARSVARRPVQPLQQLSETRQVGDRIEAAAYVRPLGPQGASNTKEAGADGEAKDAVDADTTDNALERPALNSASGVWAEQSSGDETRLTEADPDAPVLTLPELGDLPLAEDPAIDMSRQLLAEASEPTASRIISTWLPEGEATPTQWAPTDGELSAATPEAPPLIVAPTIPQTSAWQGVEAADLAPRLPADSVIPAAPGTGLVQPRMVQPGVFQPAQPGVVQVPAGPPVVVRQAPTCPPATAYAPAPVAAVPSMQSGMTVRRGLLGQPVIHMQGQPVRNFLRFVTP